MNLVSRKVYVSIMTNMSQDRPSDDTMGKYDILLKASNIREIY